MLALVALLVAMVIGSSESFLLTRVDPGKVTVQPGEGVNLLCVVDSDYEFCKWVSPRDRYCDFEWKRASGNITTQDCQIADKVSFHGRYNDRECGIRINSASVEDTGTWRCEVEQYVFLGSRGSGAVRKSDIEVTVEASTTAAPTTSTTSTRVPSTKKPRTTATTTTGATTEKVTTKSTTQEVTSTKLPQPQQPKSSMAPNSEDPEASPSVQEDQESGGSSAGVVGGVLLALLVAVAAVFGVFYYRRRKERVPIVNYATAADTANTVNNQIVSIDRILCPYSYGCSGKEYLFDCFRESPSILRATKTQISTNTFLQI